MIKSVAAGLCVLALSGTLAFAQSSQGQAGTGPIAQTTQTNPMDANARMMGKKKMMMMKKQRMMMMKKKRMMMMKKRGMM